MVRAFDSNLNDIKDGTGANIKIVLSKFIADSNRSQHGRHFAVWILPLRPTVVSLQRWNRDFKMADYELGFLPYIIWKRKVYRLFSAIFNIGQPQSQMLKKFENQIKQLVFWACAPIILHNLKENCASWLKLTELNETNCAKYSVYMP